MGSATAGLISMPASVTAKSSRSLRTGYCGSTPIRSVPSVAPDFIA
jgi:hypothetical protein